LNDLGRTGLIYIRSLHFRAFVIRDPRELRLRLSKLQVAPDLKQMFYLSAFLRNSSPSKKVFIPFYQAIAVAS